MPLVEPENSSSVHLILFGSKVYYFSLHSSLGFCSFSSISADSTCLVQGFFVWKLRYSDSLTAGFPDAILLQTNPPYLKLPDQLKNNTAAGQCGSGGESGLLPSQPGGHHLIPGHDTCPVAGLIPRADVQDTAHQ